MPRYFVSFFTDTASLAIFDPAALKHRMIDSADWWSDPYEEIKEINHGNVLFVGLGSDGQYKCNVHVGEESCSSYIIHSLIRCISGQLFIGAGEEVCGGGSGPGRIPLGALIDIPCSVYKLSVNNDTMLEILITPSSENAVNSFRESPSIMGHGA